MWRPPISFINLHYAYIVSCSLLAFIILLAYGNIAPVDAFFFGCSANTESGLNTVDVKALKTGEQLVLYFFPIITNLAFINIAVVIVRLYWFERRLREHAPWLLRKRRSGSVTTAAGQDAECGDVEAHASGRDLPVHSGEKDAEATGTSPGGQDVSARDTPNTTTDDHGANGKSPEQNRAPTISWAADLKQPSTEKTFRIPGPQQRDNGAPVEEIDDITSDDDDFDKISAANAGSSSGMRRRHGRRLSHAATSMSIERIASSMFVLGDTQDGARARSRDPSASRGQVSLPQSASTAVEDRKSSLQHLSKEELGGIEYRSLWLLLKIIVGYFVGLHIFGVICTLPWIYRADQKYRDYLDSQGQGYTWWAFYSAQTMVDNLGFTLTPDSMLSFADATWPMLVFTFLAFAGNTCYPILLRVTIWAISKVTPKRSAMQEPLQFLLDHPRRCYTLLFPSKPTWILFAILFVLNFIDVLSIIVLDLDNPAVTEGLPPGPRVLAALFQAASSRHTGTSTFNLGLVNPAVQFSLVVMMYISIFPIAFSIRASNTYEEQAVGKYGGDDVLDDQQKGTSYLLTHARNQLSFDLWWIMLGVFLIVIAESDRVADNADPSFSVFAILFEVVSGYGNVGLSLGYPTVNTSLSGKFSVVSKLIICAMMIRGRHRGLPYSLDRAIMLPGDDVVGGNALEEEEHGQRTKAIRDSEKLKRFNTY